jgi:membrane-bound lytic murein transglycosylase D
MIKNLLILLFIPSLLFSFEIPENERIKFWVNEYSKNRRDHYQLSIMRSGLYRPTIIKIFKNEGLPEDLSMLPFIESGFNCASKSTAKAAGCWQFIPRTGKYYGLGKDNWSDKRFDFNLSTVAASRYLKELHSTFKDWELALSAYNCGPTKVRREMKRVGNNYWDMNLPDQTEEYIPKFYAALKISRDLKKYGFKESKNKLVAVELKKGSHNLRYIAEKLLGVKYREFSRLNPGFEIGHTPPGESTTIYLKRNWDIVILKGFDLLAKKNAFSPNY